jgi:hypothetical protein
MSITPWMRQAASIAHHAAERAHGVVIEFIAERETDVPVDALLLQEA